MPVGGAIPCLLTPKPAWQRRFQRWLQQEMESAINETSTNDLERRIERAFWARDYAALYVLLEHHSSVRELVERREREAEVTFVLRWLESIAQLRRELQEAGTVCGGRHGPRRSDVSDRPF